MSSDANELKRFFDTMDKTQLISWLTVQYGSEAADDYKGMELKELRSELVQNHLW